MRKDVSRLLETTSVFTTWNNICEPEILAEDDNEINKQKKPFNWNLKNCSASKKKKKTGTGCGHIQGLFCVFMKHGYCY